MIQQNIMTFRARLAAMGLRPSEVERIVSSATEEIRSEIENIVSSAVNKAVDYGLSIGAKEFLAQINLDAHTGYIQISSDSGTLDFSEPELPMLPWLLKNAKTAKDGSRYKVIPVGAESVNKPEKSDLRDVSSGIGAMASSRSGVEGMAEEMARAFNGAAVTNRKPRFEAKPVKEPEFRVASSKQDQNEKWVKPRKDLDMTGLVMSINASIRSEVDEACSRIIGKYEMEAKDGLGNA